MSSSPSSSLFLCLICYLAASATAAMDEQPQQRVPRCPGGYDQGADVELGRYWYQCQYGQLVPKGCITDDRRRIEIGQSYDSNKAYRMQCIVDSRGYLSWAYKSCVYEGREHQPNEQWQDDKYYYQCERDGEYLRITVAGCIDQGQRVGINEKVTKGDFVYQCKRTLNSVCSMCPVACKKMVANTVSAIRSTTVNTCTRVTAKTIKDRSVSKLSVASTSKINA